jgi:hypothetical protein
VVRPFSDQDGQYFKIQVDIIRRCLQLSYAFFNENLLGTRFLRQSRAELWGSSAVFLD